jgi:hypothetical protein
VSALLRSGRDRLVALALLPKHKPAPVDDDVDAGPPVTLH